MRLFAVMLISLVFTTGCTGYRYQWYDSPIPVQVDLPQSTDKSD